MALSKTRKKTAFTPEAPVSIPAVLLARMAFLLNKSALRLRELTEEALKPYGLIGKHVGILWVLQERGSVPQHEIGKCIHFDRSTMVDLIDDLEKAGLVERQANPLDRRAYSVRMTPKGEEALPRLSHLALTAEKFFLACLSVKEQKELAQLLKKLVLSHYA